MRAVSLFTNCGAGDIGFAHAGFRFDVVSELVEGRLEVAALNHPQAIPIEGDLRETWPMVVSAYRASSGGDSPMLLAGCPPCQGMSSARGGRGRESDPDAGLNDGRNLLVLPIARVAEELRPVFVVVENVPAFLRRQIRDPETGGPVSAAWLLCTRLQEQYRVFALVVDLCEYGVPQTRVRAFLTFVRRGTAALDFLERTALAPFPVPTHGGRGRPAVVTLDEALHSSKLEPLDAESRASAVSGGQSLHRVPVWDRRKYQMVAAIPPGSGRSAWENTSCARCGEVQTGPSDAVCGGCSSPLLRPVKRRSDGTWRLVKGFRDSSYRRMSPERPAATITTASGFLGSDRTIHPHQNRVLSPAECAHLQSIPPDFKWGDHPKLSRVRQMIGEAVPPRFTALHGGVLSEIARGAEECRALPQDDPRCVKAHMKLMG